jgi:DNA repair exonuclease SbcCD ATPase subunit
VTPISLRITNFRSFKGTQVFEFPTEPGLYFMQGDNRAEPRLEGNGAGKSTVWDALAWVSFEKTPSGLRAGDVCNWDTDKGTVVEFDYLDGDVLCTLRRTWKPNTWTLSFTCEGIGDGEVVDLTKAESNAYLADLRLEFAPFLHSVLTSQRQPMFLDLKHDQQAVLFSSVLGLDRWLDYSAAASKKASAQDAISRGHERTLASLRGQLDASAGHDFKREAADWEEKRAARIADIERQHAELVAKGRHLKAELAAVREEEDAARAWVAKSQPPPALQSDYGIARSEVATLGELIAAERVKYDALHEHLDLLERGGVCPVCRQTISETARMADIRKAEGLLRATNEKLMALQGDRSRCLSLADGLERKLADSEKGAQKARDALADARGAEAGARRAYDTNERELDALEDRGEAIAAEPNPFIALADRAANASLRLRADIDEVQDALDDSNERYSYLSYWVRGFKEVRLVQIAEALTELEVEVNSCVTALGLVDWELNFQVDRETKGGGIQRGFNTFVRSPRNTRPVPWEAWSGGEAQRLRVAATMGLANLIRSRTGATISLEVWDEPTQGLSPQGVQDLLEALASRARNERRAIWLVDHRSHDFGGFAGGAVVTKDASGSTITQQPV